MKKFIVFSTILLAFSFSSVQAKTLSVFIIDRHEFSQNEYALPIINNNLNTIFAGVEKSIVQNPLKVNSDLDDPFLITKQDLLKYGKASSQDYIVLLKFQKIHDYYFRDMTASRYIANYEMTARVLEVNSGQYIYSSAFPAKIRNTKDQPECFSIGWGMIAEQTMAAFAKDFKLSL